MPTEQERLEFSNNIEAIAREKSCSLFDAMLFKCNDLDLEEAVAASLLSHSLKSKLECEARELNLLKGKKPKPLPGL